MLGMLSGRILTLSHHIGDVGDVGEYEDIKNIFYSNNSLSDDLERRF
jgi:hypothetical protein